MRCLVFGGGGFIGRAVSAALAQAGAEVIAFGRSNPFGVSDPRVRFKGGDVVDRAALADALSGAKVVVHLVGSADPEKSNSEPILDLTSNALEVAKGSSIRRVILASSGGTVYGPMDLLRIPESAPTNPISAYGVSKLAAEKYLAVFARLYGLEYCVLRVANPYGPGQSPLRRQGIVANAIWRALRGQKLEIWGDGSVVGDFCLYRRCRRGFRVRSCVPRVHRL
jgi:UDP-glucose 4-epimerase